MYLYQVRLYEKYIGLQEKGKENCTNIIGKNLQIIFNVVYSSLGSCCKCFFSIKKIYYNYVLQMNRCNIILCPIDWFKEVVAERQ